MQRNAAKKDVLLRAQQRMRMINQQQDPAHRIRYSQQAPKLYQAYHLPRFVIYILNINIKSCFTKNF